MLWRTPTPSRLSVTALSAALCPPAFEMEETRAQRPRRSGAPYRPEHTAAGQTEAEQTEAGQAGDCHAIRKTAVRLILAVFVLPWLAPVAAADLTGAEVAQADFTNDSARGAYLSIVSSRYPSDWTQATEGSGHRKQRLSLRTRKAGPTLAASRLTGALFGEGTSQQIQTTTNKLAGGERIAVS